MTDAAWERIEAALDELLALPEDQRAAALARLAAGDEAFRQRVQALLEQAEAPATVFKQPAAAAIAGSEAPADGLLNGLPGGTRIGAWRLEGLIGRGGMGEVYRAERADGAYQQQAALKLIRRDASDHPGRFQAERQILARLEHPGIARLLDGGVAEDGRPYMVMELVSGAAITEYARERDLDLEQRLKLYMAVCEAVAYAHRNLVIHRDLKPGNVMVTAEGQVKLLDFGIAKLMASPTAAGAEEQTRFAPVTLGYAAPEQLSGGAVTTAADVYALGVLLFELLSGRRPWSLAELPMAAALDKLLNEFAPTLSRHADKLAAPPVPAKLLRGDLDTIVAKALRKEPERRYATVDALREDIARHLDGEPVAAREGARLYALGRLLKRNRLVAASAALVLVLIVGGSLGIAWQARRAVYEARKASAVKDFLVGIFQANGRDNPDGAKARATTAEQLLDLGARRIGDEMKDVPDVRAELLGTIGGLYADLALSDRAIGLLQEQVDTLHRLYGDKPNAQLAEAEVRLGAAQSVATRYVEAERTLNAAIQALDALGDHNSLARASALLWLAHTAFKNRPFSDPVAERYATEALRILEQSHPNDGFRITVLDELALIEGERGNLDAAGGRFKQALELLGTPGFDRRPTDVANVHLEYGEMLDRAQRYDEAEVELRQSIALYLSQVGPDYPQTLRGQVDLARVLDERGRLAEARPLMAAAFEGFERVRGADDLEWTANARHLFTLLLFDRGELEAAERLLIGGIGSLRVHAPASVYLPVELRVEAELLADEGRWPEANRAISEALAGLVRFYGEQHVRYAVALNTKADLCLGQGDGLQAEALYQTVLAGWPAESGNLPDTYVDATLGLARLRLMQRQPALAAGLAEPLLKRIINSPQAGSMLVQEAAARLWLGEALRRQHKPAEALPHLRRALALREQMDDTASPWLAQVRIALAECLLDQGEQEEARRLLKLAAAAEAQHTQLGPQFRLPLQQAQARLRTPSFPSGSFAKG